MATLRATPNQTLSLSIQWNTYQPILNWPLPQEGGREGWETPKHKMAHKQQAIATTLYEELQASNCVYKS